MATSLRVRDIDLDRDLVTRGRIADTMISRMKGLIGRPALQPGDGLLIQPCKGIHTHFMRFPIDVLYIDRSGRVLAADRNVAPWRFGAIRPRASCVLELPAGTLSSFDGIEGHSLEITRLPR